MKLTVRTRVAGRRPRRAAAVACALVLLGLAVPGAAEAATILPGGPPVTVEVTTSGDTASVTFDGSSGDRVSLEITDVSIGTTSCCTTKVSLVRPDGRTLSSITVGTSGGFLDATTLPLAGTYSILVDPSSTNTGAATLNLHAVPPDLATGITPGGAPVDLDLGAPGQNAGVSFSGTAGQTVSLEATNVTIGPSVCCSTRLLLLRPDGKTLASTTFGTNGGFLDAAVLPATGTYTLLVDPQGASTGSATLTVHDVPPDTTAAITPGGPPSTVETSVPGQNARLTFSGTSGQRVSLAVSAACCSAKVTLLRPDGKTLASIFAGTFGGFLDTSTLPATGTYTILVDPQGSAVGSTTITLYDVPADATGTIVPGGPSVSVETTVPGQDARLTFSGTSGSRVSLALAAGCCSVRVSILRPNGTTLAGPGTLSSFGGFLDTATLSHTGTYTIVVDPQGSAAGSMTLTLFDVPPDATGTIAVDGQPVTVSTAVPGQDAVLTFSGTAGQRVSLVVGPSCCSVRVAILKSNGSTVAATTVGSFGGFLDTTTLPVSGTYSLVVDPQGSATGAVTVTLHDVPADVTGSIVPDGGPVLLETTVPGQNGRLTFAGTVNQRISLALTDSCCGTQLTLLKPDGSTLASTTTFGATGFLDTVRLTATGTYTILVDPRADARGRMTLTLYDVPADVTGSLVADGPPVTVTMGAPGQNARLTFTAAAGERVSLEITNVTVGSSGFSGTRVSLLNPSGTDVTSPVTVGTNGGAIDAVTLPSAGTYTVVVDPQGALTGSVTLTLHSVPVDVIATISAGGPPVTVTTVSPGQNVRASFAGVAGQRVSLELTNVSIGTSACCGGRVSVLDPNGATLVAPTSFGTTGGFVDAFALPVDGTYTILVDPQGTATGSATLTLHDVPPDAAATAVPGGASVDVGTSTPGQNAEVSFAGAVGQRVSVRIGPTCCITKLTLVGPTGSTVFGPTSFGVGGGFVDTVTLLAAGTYTLALDPFGAAVGNTTVTVYDVPPDATGTIAPGSSTTLTTSVPGQNAGATFVGSADTGVKVTVGPFNCCATKVSLLAPDGTTLVPAASFPPDGGTVLARLPVDGTYTIAVDPQGAATGAVYLALELDNSAPTPPTLTLSESSPDSHVAGASFFYRPAGGGGTFSVGAISSDAGSGLQKVRFPGLAGGFNPTSPVDDTLSPYSQSYSWSTGATYSSATNLVTAFDRVGNTSATPFGVFPDSTAPTTSDNTSALGSAWKNTTQIVTLTASDGSGAGSSLSYYTTDGTTPTTASPQGTTVTLSAEGVYTVSYFSVDFVGNVESPRTAGTQIRIDKTAPATAVLDPLPAVIKNGQLLTGSGSDALSGVASISYFRCAGSSCAPSTLIGSSSTGPSYGVAWSGQPADGTYQVLARVVDAAGNTRDSAKQTVVVDNTAPNTTITSFPANPSSSTTATFGFGSTESGSTFECRLDGGAFTTCSSPRSYSGLSEGAHTFEVRATDAVGNTDASPATYTWTIDTSAPDTTITSAPPSPNASATANFAFASSEPGSTFECRLDGGSYSACSTPKAYTGLADGPHSFDVRAVDAAGNVDPSPAGHAWTVDTAAPETTLTATPQSPTKQTDASFGFTSSEAGSTFECNLDFGGYVPCSPPQLYGPLPPGSHTFQVRATDGAGNTDPTPAAHTWTIDTTPPETVITGGPSGPTASSAATFGFGSSEPGSTFECALDGGPFAACTSPQTFTGLAEGAHTFEVRATDAAGNADPTPAARAWTVDTIAPFAPTIDSPADGSTNSTDTVTLSGTAEAGAVVEVFEGAASRGTASAGPGGTWSKALTGVLDGSHTYTATASDAAGNSSPASNAVTVVVDTTAPNTTITTGPLGSSSSTSASFTFSADEPAATFECRLDGASFAACTAPTTYTGLAEGSHTFEVRATDQAGNTDPTPATRTWTVDVTPPAAPTIASPADGSIQGTTSVTVSGTAEANSIVELFDGGTSKGVAVAGAGGSWTRTLTGVSDGAHTYTARATDAAGNTSPVSNAVTVTVDTAAPSTTITAGPSDPSGSTGATFGFDASEPGATFECRLDGAAFSACTSPQTYSGLSEGGHTFAVRAVDSAGNTDPTPANHAWTIDLTPPDAPVIASPADWSTQNSATVTLSGTAEPGTVIEVFEGAASQGTTTTDFAGGWSRTLAGVSDGAHAYTARATDSAGNTSTDSSAVNLTVDTTAPTTTITAAPADPSSSTDATFEFDAGEPGVTFECSLDGAAYSACTSPQTYSGLTAGAHTFEVRATDTAGNTESTAALHTWTVT